MIVKNKLIKIEEDNIFENDTLGREESIVDLSKLLLSTTEPFVFAINGSWGTGKTTFVKLWKEYLKKEHNAHSLYFSAWEDDFSNEPLIAILGSLNGYIEENFQDNTEVIDKFNEAKKFGGKVLKRGLPAFVKGVTGGVLDLDKGLESAIGAISEETVKELIENYSKEKEITEQFKRLINELLELLDSEQPFIIFIDELDRCRPLYAIELLERIKHIFGIEKLIFVLSIDKKQLSESIKSQYGNIDTDNYLRRFVDLEYQLGNSKIDVFCDVLYGKFELEKILKEKGIQSHHFLSVIKRLVSSFNLSLRQVEQIFSKLNIMFKVIIPRFYESHLSIFVFLEVFKIYDSTSYYNLLTSGDNRDKVKVNILSKLANDDELHLEVETILDSIRLDDEKFKKMIKKKKKQLEKEENSALVYYIQLLEFTPDGAGRYTLNKQIDTVIKKIEFLDKFNMELNE